jgi:hypothetical protein
MKPTNRLPLCVRHFGICGMLVATGGLVKVGEQMAVAQSVLANQAPTAPLTTEWQQSQPNEMEVFTPAGQAAGNAVPQIFRYGPLTLRPQLDYTFTYGNGIQSAPGYQQNTALNSIAPGILFDLGTHWSLNYTPTIQIYSGSQFHNTVDQAFSIAGNVSLDEWILGLSSAFAWTSDPLVQTASQTGQSTYQTALTASRAFNSHVSADFGLNHNITLVTGFQDSYEWSTLDWLNYQFWPRLTAGLGVGGGYDQINDTSQTVNTNNLDQTFEELQARVSWRATDKFSIQANGGMQATQFKSAGSSPSLEPIYGLTLQYQPTKTTEISLNGSRSVGSAEYYVAAQQSVMSSVSLNLNQALFQKFTLGLSAGFGQTQYSVSSGGATAGAANRTDDDVTFNVRLSHPFLKRGTWSVFYQYVDNHSTEAGYSFQSNQTGVQISYSY